MTPPMPPGLVRSHRDARPSLLTRWKLSEPVRLYAYSVLAAVLLALAVVGVITEDASAAFTGVAAAVLGIVPAAEAARASVYSPATETQRRLEDSTRWAGQLRRDAA